MKKVIFGSDKDTVRFEDLSDNIVIGIQFSNCRKIVIQVGGKFYAIGDNFKKNKSQGSFINTARLLEVARKMDTYRETVAFENMTQALTWMLDFK